MMLNITAMRKTQEAHMFDICELLKKSTSGVDQYGMPYSSFIVNGISACGLNTTASKEITNGEIPVYDARLRLPRDTNISNIDRIRITHRFGKLLDTPIEYEILGSPMNGPTGMVLNLRSIP